MFSNCSLQALGRDLQWFYTIGVSPFEWDGKYQRIRVATSKLHLATVAAYMCLYVPYSMNITWSMVDRSFNDQFKGKEDLALNFVFCCFCGTTALAVVSTWNHRNQIAGYADNFLRLDKIFSGSSDNS